MNQRNHIWSNNQEWTNSTFATTHPKSSKLINKLLHSLRNISYSKNKTKSFLFLNHTNVDIGPHIFEGIHHDYSGYYTEQTITELKNSTTEWQYHNPIGNDSNKNSSTFEILKDKKYDIIFGVFPYGVRRDPELDINLQNLIKTRADLKSKQDMSPPPSFEIIELNRSIHEIEKRINEYPRYLDLQKTSIALDILSEDGIAVFLQPVGHLRRKDINIRSLYNNNNCFLNAIISLPKYPLLNIPSDLGGRGESQIDFQLSFVSRKKQPIELLAELESYDTFSEKNIDPILPKLQTLYNNDLTCDHKLSLINNYSINLYDGIFIKSGESKDLSYYKNLQIIESLGPDFANFESLTISDVALEINMTRKEFEKRENSLYIPLLGGLQKTETDIKKINVKHQNVCQIILNTKKILPGYAKNFFNAPLGLLSIQELRDGYIPKLNKKSVSRLMIKLPDINIQKEISNMDSIMEEVKEKLDEILVNLIKSPISSQDEKDKIIQVHNVVTNVGNTAQVKYLSQQIENEILEFKSTFGLEDKDMTKQNYIEANISKAICGMLNTKGGDLIIGVTDDHEIIGVNQEVDKLYQGNWDKFSIHVSQFLSNKLGSFASAFYTQFFVPIDNVQVLWIKCKPSSKEIFVNEKTFYLRKPAQTIELVGPDMIEYISLRFNET